MMDDTAFGIGYRFRNNTRENVTVFVYPLPSDVRVGDNPQIWVSAEGSKFIRSMPYGIQRGWWNAYQVAFAKADSVEVDGTYLPGFAGAVATIRGRSVTLEMEYLYLVCGSLLKVRGTLPGRNWEESEFPVFAKELARQIARQPRP